MRSLFLVLAISVLTWARPETYKETEDFQYSRSSSDEGSKSGYYGAQRGNMAGNYERARNMDGLAQHQMSTAVRQVEGELGDAAKTRTGSVYTAANSRGVYGSGHYDLSNLQGRNFGDASSVDSSSMSSAYNQQSQNANWRAQSSLHAGSLHAADGTSGYGTSNLGGSHSHSRGYQSASGYESQNSYDQNHLSESAGSYGSQASDQSRRYTIVTPVRIVGRPGTQIAIPVYGQAYNSQRASSLLEHDSSNRQTYAQQSAASRFDQNAINSEAEVLNNNQQHISSVPVPVGKHYSNSYNYHKAWERRSETTDLPVTVMHTENPLSKHNELYEDGQSDLQQTNSHSGTAYNSASYNQAHSAQSVSSQLSHQSDYRSQHRSQSEADANAYTQGNHGTQSGLSSLIDSQPKSYQSSYSYHKSWEKQGDPYVIVPATNGEASQRLTSGNTKTSSSSQRYGSHQHYSQGGIVDCDSLCRYRRSTRSVRTEDYNQQNQDDLGQQSQTGWEENLGQQTQQQYSPAKLEDLGQQTQQSWDNFQQHSEPSKLEDLGQQTQQSWDNFQQQRRPEKLEDLGQQTQQSWGNLQQQHRPQKLEDLGQQTQGKWQLDRETESNLEDLGQQTQQSWDKSNIEQQAGRQNLHDLGQQTQGHRETVSQQSQQTFENSDNLGQQTQTKWDKLDSLGQETQKTQQTQNKWDDLDNLGQQVQTQWHNINTNNKTLHIDTTNTEQQSQTHFEGVDEINANRNDAGNNTRFTFNKENSNFNNPDNPAFWSLTEEQKHESNHYHSNYNQNSYSNSQSHGTSWRQEANNNKAQTTYNNPLQSLWDKVDNMEEQSGYSSKENQHSEYENSQHLDGQESASHHESNSESGNGSYQWNNHKPHHSGYQPPIVFNTVDKPKNDQPHNEVTTEKPKDEDLSEEPEPAEIGRGDIGAEGETATTPKTVFNSQTYATHIKPVKTPEEIEALSLSRGTDENNGSLSVLSISQQKWLEEQRQKVSKDLHQTSGSKSTTTTSTTSRNVINGDTTPKSYVHTFNHHGNDQHSESNDHKQESKNVMEEPEEIPQHNNAQQSDRIENSDYNLQQQNTVHQFGEQIHDLNQQHLHEFENSGQHSHNSEQQNTGQQLEGFGQQSQDLSQQNLQTFTNSGQHSQTFDQQNTGQQLEDFGQQSQDLSQQNLQPFTNMGQHSESFDQQNTGQQLEDFGQQSQDLSQQNLQQFTNLGQHSQTFDQQNTGQELEDFGQQNQDLSQQNLQPFTNLGQHSENFDQKNDGPQLGDFGQQSQNSNQQNLKPLWGEHTQNLNQQQAREFVPYSNSQIIQEETITPVKLHSSESQPKHEVEILPPSVTTTEKPGFWKSVGNKLSGAKDSVASWFRRS